MTPDQHALDLAARTEHRRRLLLIGSGAVVAAGLAAPVGAAEAVETKPKKPRTKPSWRLAGTSGVAADGRHFVGPLNVAPLIFKTRATGTPRPVERMRIAPTGQVGVGTPTPGARLDVLSPSLVALRGRSQDASASGRGVVGQAGNGYGVHGLATAGDGVRGEATSGIGVHGVAADGYGVRGDSSGVGVFGNGESAGVYGSSGAGDGLFGSGTRGVVGSGTSVGVVGVSGTTAVSGNNSGTSGDGVHGSGGQYGVRGTAAATAGVRGDSGYVGAWGQGTTYGVYGLAAGSTGQNYGLFGQSSSPDGYAVFAQGRAHVNGTLSKSAGSFRIDHPLDPERQWLHHSFVESPDMLNIYNGNVVLDDDGAATVELPSYFTALNRDYRYQLTCIGGHAPVYVARKVEDGTFAIAGGTPGLEVSWQVTGIRQDDYANDHRIPVETPKNAAERGTRAYVARGSAGTRMRFAPSS